MFTCPKRNIVYVYVLVSYLNGSYWHLFSIFYVFSCRPISFVVVMSQIKAMADDIQPLLAEVRDSGLLKEVENLTRSLTQASEDLR
jgi:hypothetical protein